MGLMEGTSHGLRNDLVRGRQVQQDSADNLRGCKGGHNWRHAIRPNRVRSLVVHLGAQQRANERIHTSVGELDRVSCCQLACLARIYNNTRLNGAAISVLRESC